MAGPDEWDVKLKEIIDNQVSYGNNPKTKILVMSDDVARDEEKIKAITASLKVRFAPVLDLKEEEHLWKSREEEETFLRKVFESKPTVIVVASADHGAKVDVIVKENGEVGYKFKPWKDMQGTVFEPLRRNYRIDEELLAYREKSFVICEPWDVYHLEGGCLLSSLVPSTVPGLFREWQGLIQDGKIETGHKIAIITGFHGSNRTNEWVPTSYGGVSAFTWPIQHLDYRFYYWICGRLDIAEAERAKDPLNYTGIERDSRTGPPPDREVFPITSIDYDTWREYGENANPKPTWQTARASELGCDMKAAVFNLAYYHKDTRRFKYYAEQNLPRGRIVLLEYLIAKKLDENKNDDELYEECKKKHSEMTRDESVQYRTWLNGVQSFLRDNPYDHLKRLIRDLKELEEKGGLPTHFFNNTCYSSNNDLAIAMRATADIFSELLLNRDIQAITGNSEARISDVQREFLNSAIKDENKHILVAGNKGSGKTLIAAEIAKAKIAKAIASGQKKIKVIVRLRGVIYEGEVCVCVCSDLFLKVPSQLANDFETRYLDGFLPEIKNFYILEELSTETTRRKGEKATREQQDASFDIGTFLKKFNSPKAFHDWITEEFNTPTDETVVMLLDDMILKDLKDFTIPENLNGSVIFCTSQVQEMFDQAAGWQNRGWCIPNDGQGQLDKSYRYTPKIAQFLRDLGDYRGERVLPPDDGCPRPLSVTEHPVIWLKVRDGRKDDPLQDFKQTVLRMRDVVLSKLPDEEKGDDRNVLCIAEDGMMVDRGGYRPPHGAEADVGIVSVFFYDLEPYSRARKQLFIVTYWDENDPRTQESERLEQWQPMEVCLNKAWENQQLVKKNVTYAELQDGSWWDKEPEEPNPN